MENKIIIAELLKDCPTGMELYSTMFENLEFDRIEEDNGEYYIICRVKTEIGYNIHTFTKHGCFSANKYAKCVIFPKGKTTWEGFVPPGKFKDGDILATNLGSVFYLNPCLNTDGCYGCYVGISCDGSFRIREPFAYKECCGLATEEEKQKLFQAIKANGYEWNAETKILKKLPRFKVGDRVKSIFNNCQYIITELTDTRYTLVEVNNKFKYTEPIIDDKNWELVPNKFDINTLVPFESKVLVRNSDSGFWKPAFWGIYEAERSNEHQYRNYLTTEGFFRHCIPYNDETKHLIGKTSDCPEYYKTWKE